MLCRFKAVITLFLLMCCSLVWAQGVSSNVASLIDVKGAIGPATQEYVTKSILSAESRQVSLIILQIDTPGGLSKSMRGIIKVMLASQVPIVAYVAPSGAHAASAGTYLLYAANIAAMAPGTNLGAATPVNLMKTNDKDKSGKQSASELKAINDAKAYIRSLAQLRKRNVTWAEKAVQHAESLSAQEALKQKVINFVAPNIKNLMSQIDGKTIQFHGKPLTLDTKHIAIITHKPSWRANLLAVIADPMIAYIFLIIAFYGIFFEFAQPGLIAPGVIGAIALILGLYGLQMLPINYVGLGLIFFAFLLFIVEVFVTSFGILFLGGLVSLIFGSIVLMDDQPIGFDVPWQLILGVAIATCIYMFIILQMVIRVRRYPKITGLDVLIGQEGDVLLDGKKAWLQVNGELWAIDNPEQLSQGSRATVKSVKGMSVVVEQDN